jgi:(4S)-4-hydroxy-5-phosphonooxypentane-2,3-dione isomerase
MRLLRRVTAALCRVRDTRGLSMPTPYINAVELDIVPAGYEKFKAAILENAASSVKEPGCRQFDVLFEDGDPHHVFLYEVYDDAAALEAHRATAHFKKYWEATAPMIAKRVARHMSPIAFNIKAR